MPWRKLFWPTRALPSGVFGPVERVHGFHSRIFAACRARRSGVHPFLCFRAVPVVISNDPLVCMHTRGMRMRLPRAQAQAGRLPHIKCVSVWGGEPRCRLPRGEDQCQSSHETHHRIKNLFCQEILRRRLNSCANSSKIFLRWNGHISVSARWTNEKSQQGL
jgi:hypothetical protein